MDPALPVLPTLPQGEDYLRLRVHVLERWTQTSYYWCQHCGGWIQAWPLIAAAAPPASGWDYGCRRCGNRLVLVGMVAAPRIEPSEPKAKEGDQ